MSSFIAGQRWISLSEPELGLATVLRVDARQIQVLYPATGVMRMYAVQSAPLVRAEFKVGDRISVHGKTYPIDKVVEQQGLLHYCSGPQQYPEGALDDRQSISKASDRLIATRVDRNDQFELRAEALAKTAAAKRDPGYGILSARIDLIDHQLRVARIAAQRRPPRILFADEVGLGKTIESCLVMAKSLATGRISRALVIVPEALVYQWFVELMRRFNLGFAIFDEERVEAIEVAGDGRNPFQDEQWVLTDLAFLSKHPERARQAVEAGWDLLVVDEAHHLQWTPEGASAEYALIDALAKKTPGVLLLTATPEQLGKTGHFARLRLLDPARFYDLGQYQIETESYVRLSQLAEKLIEDEALDEADERFLRELLGEAYRPEQMRGSQDAEYKRGILRQLVDRHGTGRIMFRNRRAAVGGFPVRVPHLEIIPFDEANRAFYSAHLEEFLGDIAEPTFTPSLNYADDPRLAWLQALIEYAAPEKILLICKNQAKLHALDEALRLRSGVKVARFHEGLGIVQRDRSAAHFAEPDGARVMLCTEIGSEGRNFQFAHHLVLWDLPLDPDLLEQRIGRLDRIGQAHAVHIHACALEHSAQHVMCKWYDEGLDAFRAHAESGREIYKKFKRRVVKTALETARAEVDAPGDLEVLMLETRSAHRSLVDEIAKGRDRLLELNAQLDGDAQSLKDALARNDHDDSAQDFILRLFELFGVGVEDLGAGIMLLDPEMLITEAFPGLDQPRQATFDRNVALAREEVLFLRMDHPMVVGAVELLLSGETGNAAFLVDDGLPKRSALLEAVFVLECMAPPALAIERFLPALPIRVVVDSKLQDRSSFKPDPRSVQKSLDRGIDWSKQRKPIATLVPPLLDAAEKIARKKSHHEAQRAVEQAYGELAIEIERLEALAQVNPGIKRAEIEAAKEEQRQLVDLLPQAKPRLDALRFIVSGDFLELRA